MIVINTIQQAAAEIHRLQTIQHADRIRRMAELPAYVAERQSLLELAEVEEAMSGRPLMHVVRCDLS